MANQFVRYPKESSSSAPVKFLLDTVAKEVNKDTVTPANNEPLPVQLLDTSGNINRVTVGSSALPTGAATEVTLSGILTKMSDNLQTVQLTDSSGNKVKVRALGSAIVSGDNALVMQSVIHGLSSGGGGSYVDVKVTPSGALNAACTQDGTWNITNISGTVSLPTGAATETTLSTLNSKIPSNLTVTSTRLLVDGSGVTQPISAASLPLPTGAATETTLSSMSGKLPATLGQKAMTASMAVVIASDQSAVPASQSGTWNITNISGTVSLPTGAATSANQTTANSSLSSIDGKLGSLGQKTMSGSAPVVIASDQSAIATKSGGATLVTKSRNDYTSTNVTTSAYVQLVASTASAINAIEIFDSSGQTLVLATGGAGSEVDQLYIFPGGNGRIPFTIAASTRVSIKAVSGTASVGENTINYYA